MSMARAEAGLTIGAVAARTGLSVPVLRSWEQRHGFPRPARLDGGHRRYDEDDVARILRVVEARAEGRSLEASIAIAQRDPAQAPADGEIDGTVYAGLRRRRPDLEVRVLSRRAMRALSHAIEDECLAQADQPTVTGAFQRVNAYEQALPRWRELARSGASTLVFADFSRSGTRHGVQQVAIPPSAPLAREWSVICDAASSAAALAGWERADGQFEAVWSLEPDVVRLATQLGRQLAAHLAPRLTLPPAPREPLHHSPGLRRATAVTNRAIAYLDR
ncbi:MAG: DICT sensory domain-containing protein [Acidimicrobiales bacterium]